VDKAGNVYVADSDNNLIRKVTASGMVTTLAGDPQAGFDASDGVGNAAHFWRPKGLVVDNSTNLYVADQGNSTIRRISPVGTNWVVTTLAGSAQAGGATDGIGSSALFAAPFGVALYGAGNLFVTDQYNQTIREITPNGEVTTLAGTPGEIGDADGVGRAAQFSYPFGIAMDSLGYLYVATGGCIAKGTPRLDLAALRFLTGSSVVSNGNFHARLTGPPGSNVVVLASANLQTWTPIQTNILPSTGLDVSVSLGAGTYKFFRGHLGP